MVQYQAVPQLVEGIQNVIRLLNLGRLLFGVGVGEHVALVRDTPQPEDVLGSGEPGNRASGAETGMHNVQGRGRRRRGDRGRQWPAVARQQQGQASTPGEAEEGRAPPPSQSRYNSQPMNRCSKHSSRAQLGARPGQVHMVIVVHFA